jgi:hypothetical protein
VLAHCRNNSLCRVVIVSVLIFSFVYRGFLTLSIQTKDYEIGICCFFAKYTLLRRKTKTGWLGIRIMCLSEATCLHTDCCFCSEDWKPKNLKILEQSSKEPKQDTNIAKHRWWNVLFKLYPMSLFKKTSSSRRRCSNNLYSIFNFIVPHCDSS